MVKKITTVVITIATIVLIAIHIGVSFIPVTVTYDDGKQEKYANMYTYTYHETFK